MSSTIYDVKLRYYLEDKATRGVGGLARQTERAAKSSSMLSGALGRIGTLMAGAFGIHQAKKALIGFNDQMEQSRIQMAGMLQLNMGGGFNENMERSVHLVDRLQQRAKASVGTTKDMVDMASMLSRPLGAAGASMKDIEDVSVAAVVASRAMGIEATVAARDVEAALMGNLRSMDRFARSMLEPMGYTVEKFNALTGPERMRVLQKAFDSPAIRNMAKAQENSFSGVMSTLQDSIEMTLGKVGLPLFRRLTEEVKSWNSWMEANENRIKAISKTIGANLVKGFETIREIGAFFVKHKSILTTIAKLWAVNKTGEILAGPVNGMMRAMQMMQGSKGIGGIIGKISGAGGIIGAFASLYVALDGAAGWILDWKDRMLRRDTELSTYRSSAKAFDSDLALTTIRRGGMDEDFKRASFNMLLRAIDAGSLTAGTSSNDPFSFSQEHLVSALKGKGMGAPEAIDFASKAADAFALLGNKGMNANLLRQSVMNALGMGVINKESIEGYDKKGAAGNGDMNVRIDRIEVVSDDPDRFAFDFTAAMDDLARNPTGAIGKFPRRF